jgi:hypothetical protein
MQTSMPHIFNVRLPNYENYIYHSACTIIYLLPLSQIIRHSKNRHSKNLGESKDLKFDQIYMIR